VKSYPGPPMTLGNAAAAQVRLIVSCKECQHQVEPAAANWWITALPRVIGGTIAMNAT
jgi:hypothetical protein